jgi:hypothetical protein
MKTTITIVCTPLEFYTQNDESLLFNWIKKIRSIKNIKGIGNKLHLYLESQNIPNKDLLDLMGIFDRYQFNNAEQLKIFMNDDNKEWFD